MILTILNLKNAIPNNHNFKHTVKQSQIIKGHYTLIKSAIKEETRAPLSHDVLNDKLTVIAKFNFESRTQYYAQPKYATLKLYEDFFKKSQDLPNKRASDTYFFPHKPYNCSSSQPLFAIKILLPDEDSLHMIKQLDKISLLTVTPDLSLQTNATLLFASLTKQNITLAPVPLGAISQTNMSDFSHLYSFHILWGTKSLLI